jgi:adenylosuccinate lyase
MIPRYSNAKVDAVWTHEAKLRRWDKVELAVIEARVEQGAVPQSSSNEIRNALLSNAADITWWIERDLEIRHDLNAYIDERRRYISPSLQHLFHQDMTSYDTEEPATALALIECCTLVENAYEIFIDILRTSARKYRYLPFLERTHGQGAKLRSLGGRMITWMAELDEAYPAFEEALKSLRRSRISGAIGNYGGKLSPQIEKRALEILGLSPLKGSTQIVTRVIQARLAQAIQLLAEPLGKIANDIRLGARSGCPIVQEPFGKRQKGSSAMPHKKNTIRTEQVEGLLRMIRGDVSALVAAIQTWEGRSIEQSSVERVNWPDVFHLVLRILNELGGVIDKLAVYPDNMYREIRDSRGTYATDEAKNFLAEKLAEKGKDAEIAYRIVQLASFGVFEPKGHVWRELRTAVPDSLSLADDYLEMVESAPPEEVNNVRDLILEGGLVPVEALEASQEDADEWNRLLQDIFSVEDTRAKWHETFSIGYLLRSEDDIFREYHLT